MAIILTLVACGGGAAGGGTPSPTTPLSLEYDHRAGALVVEADTYGGLMRPGPGKHVAKLSIYGDGLVVLGGEETIGGATDRVVISGHVSDEELSSLLSRLADRGFFQLQDRYQPSPAPTDLPSRWVTVNLLEVSKTVTVYPPDYGDAPAAFREVYSELVGLYPADAGVFAPTSGTMTAVDLGPIDDLPAGQRNQVAPWDRPLVGIDLAQATEGAYLEGQQYEIVEEFVLRYPPGQLFGSQERRAYQVSLEARLPWENTVP